ncbi:putative Brix domain-containing protein 1 variant 1 [Ramicandelaber brevisporus]|nr:putative Brix domain-containing protein 1 variant 1 [Ramicandelaber brevisporus]
MIKAKSSRGKRALQEKAPKLVENGKTALFIKGAHTSLVVNCTMGDLAQLKKPDAVLFNKKNQLNPFEDETPFEFFSDRNDASLFMFGSHSKKRPNNLVMGRMFDHKLLDMIELGIDRCEPMSLFDTQKCASGLKPLFLFNSVLFEQNDLYIKIKNMFLDFYHGETAEFVHLEGLEHVIVVTAGPLEADGSPGKIYWRVYTVQLKNSGTRLPRVELEEMGPSLDFSIRRTKFANSELYHAATRVPKQQLRQAKTKNIEHGGVGQTFGRIHLGKQELDKIQTRKVKALKRSTVEREADDSEDSKRRRTSDD